MWILSLIWLLTVKFNEIRSTDLGSSGNVIPTVNHWFGEPWRRHCQLPPTAGNSVMHILKISSAVQWDLWKIRPLCILKSSFLVKVISSNKISFDKNVWSCSRRAHIRWHQPLNCIDLLLKDIGLVLNY